jgi:hypothetical protein
MQPTCMSFAFWSCKPWLDAAVQASHTHPRHGVKKRQAKSAGKQKVSTAKVKEAKPDSTCVLVYSLGHEMYKWGA